MISKERGFAVYLNLTIYSLEGPWDRVHEVIGQAHTLLHQQGVVRIQTDIRVGSRYVFAYFAYFWVLFLAIGVCCTCEMIRQHLLITGLMECRTDKVQTSEDKVNKVRELLGKE